MRMESDGITPKVVQNPEYYRAKMQSLNFRINATKSALGEKATKARKKELTDELAKLTKDMEELVDEIGYAADHPDEIIGEAVPYNECIGYCYGKGIYIDDNDDLRWQEMPEEYAIIGDPELHIDLLPNLAELPAGEQKMILGYLISSEDTPEKYRDILQYALARIGDDKNGNKPLLQ